MTFGEKLTRLRKQNNYTQEQLADILDVSRQSVSKWELDLAYPETDKLIRLGELFDCSMDYLLKDDAAPQSENRASATAQAPSTPIFNPFSMLVYEKKSKTVIRGLPLWHINIGLGRTAKGIIAIGFSARGVVSFGLFSVGVISGGVLSLGALTFGVAVLGLLAFGAVSVGLIAFGAVAAGLLAVGALAVGEFAIGAAAYGNYFAFGDVARAAVAVGKTTADGSLFSAHAITRENGAEIITHLNSITPTFFVPLKTLVTAFFPYLR